MLETIKELANVYRESGKAEEYKKILDLQGQVQDLMQELFELKRRNTELEEKWCIHGDLEFRENAYWRKSGDGPFCVPCWDKNKVLMRMTGKTGECVCHVCGFRMSPVKVRVSRAR